MITKLHWLALKNSLDANKNYYQASSLIKALMKEYPSLRNKDASSSLKDNLSYGLVFEKFILYSDITIKNKNKKILRVVWSDAVSKLLAYKLKYDVLNLFGRDLVKGDLKNIMLDCVKYGIIFDSKDLEGE